MARTIIKASAVRLAAPVMATPQHGGAEGCATACADGAPVPSIRFVRNGDLTEGLEITCACGRVTRFDCLYGGEDAEGKTP